MHGRLSLPDKPMTATLPITFYANYPAAEGNYPDPLSAINRCASKASEIVLLSAFYTPEFVLRFLANVPPGKARKSCKVQVVVNGLRGAARTAQLKELRKTRASLLKMGFQSPDIRVSHAIRLFHTKLYQFRSENQLSWFVGSANASEFAFGSNDEILVMCRGKHPHVARYVEDILKGSVGIGTELVEPPPSTLVHLFKTGVLYFKSSLRPQFLFDRIRVPRSLRGTGERPPHTDPNEPFGPFNERRCLEYLGSSSPHVRDDEAAERTKAALTPYSVETCFGLWVPSTYVNLVEENIDRRSGAVEQDLGAVARKLAASRMKVRQEFSKSYLGFLKSHGVLIPANTETKFERFLGRLVAKLADEKYRKRCARPFLDVGMPEIWADPIASREFSDTFMEYIAFRLSQTGNKPRVIKNFQKAADLQSQDNVDEVRKKIENWIRTLRSNAEFEEALT